MEEEAVLELVLEDVAGRGLGISLGIHALLGEDGTEHGYSPLLIDG